MRREVFLSNGTFPAASPVIYMKMRKQLIKRNPFSIWLRAVRPHFVPPSILPALLGSMIGWSRLHVFKWEEFALVMVGVVFNHFGLNMIDDVFDFLNSIDQSHIDEKNPYTGGSGVLTDGLLTVRQMIWGSGTCFGITALIGFYLTFTCGLPVLLLGIIGFASSLFYAMPPIKFGYRGLGEVGLLINFGPVIVLGSYYVQTLSLSIEPFLVSLILGLMMWSMIIINEIPDYEEDLHGGKLNLVARFGRKRALRLYAGGLISAYVIMLTLILLKVTPFLTILGFAGLPLAIQSWKVLKAHYKDSIKVIPANLAMIKVHAVTGLSLVIGYGIEGMLRAA
jgi:1,4-dihydroxy-2-naphthoate octaprenyltransferase